MTRINADGDPSFAFSSRNSRAFLFNAGSDRRLSGESAEGKSVNARPFAPLARYSAVGANRGMIYPEKSGEHLHDMLGLAQAFFEPLSDLGSIAAVGEADLPPDYLTLLAHTGHMTITLEAWHEALVDIRVEGEAREPNRYARHSLLSRQSDGRVVQSGVMRINLTGLPAEVRHEIEVGETPLGRILIRADLLREVELLALWRIAAGPRLARELDLPQGTPVHGRSARILVEGRPAVELLEIVRP